MIQSKTYGLKTVINYIRRWGGLLLSKENKTKNRKGKVKMIGWIIVIIIIAVIGIGGAIGWSYLSKELSEAKNLIINEVDFSKLEDGTYVGEYSGGMYKWRTNKVQVTVTSGKVIKIKILYNKENRPAEFTNKLYDNVIQSQSLKVDTISGATLTSKAYLKAIENALSQSQ